MGTEALISNGVPELGSAVKSAERIHRALAGLESTKEAYAQELLKLKALIDAIPKTSEEVTDESFPSSNAELHEFPTLLKNLLRDQEDLVEELRQQKAKCEELQRALAQEHREKLEAQMCLSVLNDTVKTALQGERFLVEQNRHLVFEQERLASKLKEVSKSRLPVFESQIRNVECACSSIKQEEVVIILYNKVCVRGLWVFLELVLLCHAMLWFIIGTLKENYTFAPT